MALSRQQKEAAVAELAELLKESKITVFANYQGLGVRAIQELRKQARENGTTVTVAKNRLVRVALKQNESLKDVDSTALNGQLLYAFNSEDEVAPAQLLHTFSKEHPEIKLAGAIDAEGSTLDEAQVNALAQLPSKDQLRAQLVGTLAGPARGFVTVLSGNARGLLNVLNARKQDLENA